MKSEFGQYSEEDRVKVPSSHLRECSGTVEKLLNVSLQEEQVRNQILQTDREMQELQALLMQTQQELQCKIELRNQVKILQFLIW